MNAHFRTEELAKQWIEEKGGELYDQKFNATNTCNCGDTNAIYFWHDTRLHSVLICEFCGIVESERDFPLLNSFFKE